MAVYCTIKDPMRLTQVWRHQIGIVKIGQGGIRVGGAGIQNRLRQRLQL